MPRNNKNISMEEDEPAGAPEWMVTFSDCMTLLLTFFVLLLSFSSFDEDKIQRLGRSFALALTSIGTSDMKNQDSINEKQPSSKEVKAEGSEIPSNTAEETTNFMKEKRPLDYQNLKVFTIESRDFFVGDTHLISSEGRKALETLANYLNGRIGRIVVSENGPNGNTSLGLNRSITVMEHLTKEHTVNKSRFNISCNTTMRQPPRKRQLEITLLDRSVYE